MRKALPLLMLFVLILLGYQNINANVFASGIRISDESVTDYALASNTWDGDFTNGGIKIWFIINENGGGTLNAIVTIKQGATVIRTLVVPSPAKGVNSVIWNGFNSSAQPAPTGSYTFEVTVTDPVGHVAFDSLWVAGSILQNATDFDGLTSFAYRGNASIIDQTNAAFGRIYVSRGTTQTTTPNGFYELRADGEYLQKIATAGWVNSTPNEVATLSGNVYGLAGYGFTGGGYTLGFNALSNTKVDSINWKNINVRGLLIRVEGSDTVLYSALSGSGTFNSIMKYNKTVGDTVIYIDMRPYITTTGYIKSFVFDDANNCYVAFGEASTTRKSLAKFDAAGTFLWKKDLDVDYLLASGSLFQSLALYRGTNLTSTADDKLYALIYSPTITQWGIYSVALDGATITQLISPLGASTAATSQIINVDPVGNVIWSNGSTSERIIAFSPADGPNSFKTVNPTGYEINVTTAALPLYTILWERSAATTSLPTWFSTTSLERGLAYGKVGGNDRVYVVSRNGGTFVKILNATTGADVGDLNTTGVSGGTFPLNDVGVTADGKIFAANLNAPTAPATADFKVYRWDDESSAPVVAITYNTGLRLGDKITVIGDYSAGTAEIWAASATTGQHKVFKWTMTGGVFNQTPIEIVCSDALGTGIASAAVGPLPNGDFYWNANGQNARKYRADGTLIGVVPGGIVATGSNAIRYLGTIDGKEYVATFAYGTGNENARILEIPDGDPTKAILYAVTPTLGSNSNGNGTGDVDFSLNPDFTVSVFALSTNNGLGGYNLYDLDFTPAAPARVQIIHNSADVLADSVDIYVNGNLALDDLAFRTATPFIDLPSEVTLNIGIAPKTSTSVTDTLVNFPVVLAEGETYVVFANGVLDPGLYAANPDGRSTAFNLIVKEGARETAVGTGVDLFVMHGVTDAPTVDFKARELNLVLVNDIAYSDVTDYINSPAQNFTLDVYLSDGTTYLGSYAALIAGLDGQSAAVFASGFGDTDQNQDGANVGIYAALANGTVVQLPFITPIVEARADYDNNLIPDRLNDTLTIRGTVISPNYQTTNHSYYIWDGTAGITEILFGTTNPVLNLGDDVFVTGVIGIFRGLTQIQAPNSNAIQILSTGNPVPDPVVLTVAEYLANPEAYEGTLVGFVAVNKVGGTWPTAGTSSTLQISDGTGTVDLRIDSDTDLDNNPEPSWPVDIIGLGSQFSTGTTVYDNGYQILPRYYATDVLPAYTIPVELIALEATFNEGKVTLTWSTATETNNQGFEVQRSSDGEFVKVGFVPGFGTTTETKQYSFTENNLPVGTYSYRLKQVDFDGTFEYSKVVEVEVLAPKVFDLAQNYPNPFNPNTVIEYSIASPVNVTLTIYSVLGEQVAVLVNNQFTEAGKYTVQFNAANLASGTYIYRLQAGDFVSTKKMLLMK